MDVVLTKKNSDLLHFQGAIHLFIQLEFSHTWNFLADPFHLGLLKFHCNRNEQHY